MTSAAEVIAAPYFSLSNAAWIPCAVTWDLEAASLGGSRGFESYRAAIEASRFLVRLDHCALDTAIEARRAPSCLRREAPFLLIRAVHLPLDGGNVRA